MKKISLEEAVRRINKLGGETSVRLLQEGGSHTVNISKRGHYILVCDFRLCEKPCHFDWVFSVRNAEGKETARWHVMRNLKNA